MEVYECANCFHKVNLDEHGKCALCGSVAVISLHLISVQETYDVLRSLFTNDELTTLFGIICGKPGEA